MRFLPKQMMWTELLFSHFPIDRENFAQQMLARLSFLFLVWLSGVFAYASAGLLLSYLTDLNMYQMLFGPSFIVLFGSYMVQRSLPNVILSVRPMLRLDDGQFQRFSQRIERFLNSLLPCAFLTLLFVAFLSGIPSGLQQTLSGGLKAHLIWNLSAVSFFYLLTSTGVWMFAVLWLAIFLISRQELKVELSATTIERFRGLTMLTLWCTLFYFLALSIGVVAALVSLPSVESLLQAFASPFLVFVAIGVLGGLAPLYNIHRALVKLKRRELAEIDSESQKLLQQLDEVLDERHAGRSGDQTIAIMARLFSLQVKERRVNEAQEWPINLTFVSQLAGLASMPGVAGILMEVLKGTLI